MTFGLDRGRSSSFPSAENIWMFLIGKAYCSQATIYLIQNIVSTVIRHGLMSAFISPRYEDKSHVLGKTFGTGWDLQYNEGPCVVFPPRLYQLEFRACAHRLPGCSHPGEDLGTSCFSTASRRLVHHCRRRYSTLWRSSGDFR
jgi:hypothetical protein